MAPLPPVFFQVSGGLLQTDKTWANEGVCGASCAHALGSLFVCLFGLFCSLGIDIYKL